MNALTRLLNRANVAGRTRVRCWHCDRPINRDDRDEGLIYWRTDDGELTCRAQLARSRVPALHEPMTP